MEAACLAEAIRAGDVKVAEVLSESINDRISL
jgi:hypothetical protein